MIALAAVAVATGVQAAQVDWSAQRNFIKDTNGSAALKEQNVYLVLATAGDTFDTFKANLADGTVNASNIKNNGLYLGTGVTDSGDGKLTKISSEAGKGGLIADGNPYTLAYVTFDTVGGKDYYYLSSTQTAKAWDDDTPYTHDLSTPANWMGTTFNKANWHEVQSVPEPTSGLLLLLGVAGTARGSGTNNTVV